MGTKEHQWDAPIDRFPFGEKSNLHLTCRYDLIHPFILLARPYISGLNGVRVIRQ